MIILIKKIMRKYKLTIRNSQFAVLNLQLVYLSFTATLNSLLPTSYS